MVAKRKRIALAIAAILLAVVAPVLVPRLGKSSAPKETPPLSESEKTQRMLEERAQDPEYMANLQKIEREQNAIAGERLDAAERFARWEERWLESNEKARAMHAEMLSARDDAAKARLREEYEEEVRLDKEGAKLLAAVKGAEARLEALRHAAGAVIGERIRRQRPSQDAGLREKFEERRASGLVKEVKAPPKRDVRSERPPHTFNGKSGRTPETASEGTPRAKEEKL